jgi:hypothetical protein
MSCGDGHLGFAIGIKNRNFVEDLPMILPGQFGFNCPVRVITKLPNSEQSYKTLGFLVRYEIQNGGYGMTFL